MKLKMAADQVLKRFARQIRKEDASRKAKAFSTGSTMQIAKSTYSLAQDHNNCALMIGAYRALAVAFYCLGDFEIARQNAMRGVQMWRSGGVQSPVEEISTPETICRCYEGLCEWHIGEIASCHAAIAEAISLARELNDMHALAVALYWSGWLAHVEGFPSEVERWASDLIELSTRQNFAIWLAGGEVFAAGREALPGIRSRVSRGLRMG